MYPQNFKVLHQAPTAIQRMICDSYPFKSGDHRFNPKQNGCVGVLCTWEVKSCCCSCLPSLKSQDRTVLSRPPVHSLVPSLEMSIQLAPSVWPWNCLQKSTWHSLCNSIVDHSFSDRMMSLVLLAVFILICFLRTLQESGCEDPRRLCFRRSNRKSRPWSRGWWPEHNTRVLTKSVQL